MGDKEANLRTAVRLINDRIGKVTSLSSFYRTAPWGFVSDNDFLNAAACSETLLDPLEVLHLTQAIEKEMGRTAKSVERVYSDRPIDIDLLMYDDTVMQTPELTLPHPADGGTEFRHGPLAEIAGEMVHPVSGLTMEEMRKGLPNLYKAMLKEG